MDGAITRIRSVISRLLVTLRSGLALAWDWVRPSEDAWRGARAAALGLGLLIYLAWLIFAQSGPFLLRAAGTIFYLILGGLVVLGAQLISLMVGWVARVPDSFRWRVLGGMVFVVLAFFLGNLPGLLVLALGLVLTAALAGGCAWSLVVLLRRPGEWNLVPLGRRTILVLGMLLGVAGLAIAAVWLGGRGFAPRPQIAAARQGAPLLRVDLDNPAEPGPYAVASLTYGSGSDRFRPEFGAQADVQTRPVDGSKLLTGTWGGPAGWIRPWVWGFGVDALPLNGRVWYPQAKDGAAPSEPFPLVLVVHGNHNMQDFSDAGYAYLGQLLASRGFILVSVDENFLNSGFTDIVSPTRNENDARAWLLLEHLRQWQAWAEDPDSLFYGRVDMDRIGLIGHSRGGEAAALAAAFNRLAAFPENGAQPFDYHFGIRAVAAIAPIDGQYWPAGRATVLEDVDYLVLHGTHDADVSSFDGINQYERVRFNPDEAHFKAAVYIYRANHGQFNAIWGDSDYPPLTSLLINRQALLSTGEQQQIAGVYLSAFLEASLHGASGYRALFQDARAAGEGWLPDTIYLNRYAETGGQILADYEEDIDLTTASLPGSTIEANGLAIWGEDRLQLRWGGGETSLVSLGWDEAARATYTITLPESAPSPDPAGTVVFDLADAMHDPPPAPVTPAPSHGVSRLPIDLTVALLDAAGQEARLPLSTRMPVQPQLVVDVWKLPWFRSGAASEPALQSYRFALAEFSKANRNFDLSHVRSVRFIFDRTPRGSVLLDGVGFGD